MEDALEELCAAMLWYLAHESCREGWTLSKRETQRRFEESFPTLADRERTKRKGRKEAA